MGWSMSRRGNPQKRRLLSLAVACVFLNASHSHAQLYKWVDEHGRVQYSDTVPPSATDRARQELRSDGGVKSATERAATAEEKRLTALKAAEDAKARELQSERERKDKALAATYVDLADFDRVRDRALATVDQEILALAERETFLNRVLATPAGQQPPAEKVLDTSASAANAKPPAAPAKPAVVKSANARMIEAKAELPRLADAITRKRRDRADLAALYATDRVRLANLIDAEKAKLANATSAANAASGKTSVPVPAPKK